MLEVLSIGAIVFPGTGIQDTLHDKAKRLDIPVWRFTKDTATWASFCLRIAPSLNATSRRWRKCMRAPYALDHAPMPVARVPDSNHSEGAVKSIPIARTRRLCARNRLGIAVWPAASQSHRERRRTDQDCTLHKVLLRACN